jgi:hypothetical protein
VAGLGILGHGGEAKKSVKGLETCEKVI